MKTALTGWLILAGAGAAAGAQSAPGEPRPWGNALYVDLAVGGTCRYLGKTVKLVSVTNNFCTVSVDGVGVQLVVARRALPQTVNGVRLFVADNRPVERITTDTGFPNVHGALTRDALLCLSDPARPLLDPRTYTFPISRADGYAWSMEEYSHMFAYLGPTRCHEGVDLDLHPARGQELHALVAVEAGIVRWVDRSNADGLQACVLLESSAQPGVYYVYQHLNRAKVYVSAGQTVSRGQRLAYIWGDDAWGHLHFSVVGFGPAPSYADRYRNLLNSFPQLYELWHGDLRPRPRTYPQGTFQFGRSRAVAGGCRARNSSYDDVIGYGWRLGAWNTAAMVERSTARDACRNVRLRKTLFGGTAAAATNPNGAYDFEVAVPPGRYAVKALVGDETLASWQKVHFEGVDAGTYAPPANTYAWTPEKTLDVTDGRLTLRFTLRDSSTPAGLNELRFQRVGDVPSSTAPPAASATAGLTGEYFGTPDLSGTPLYRTDPRIDFQWGRGSPDASLEPDSFSVRWTGQVEAQFTERYTFYTLTDDGVRLWVGDRLLIDAWTDQSSAEWSGQIDLVAGQKVRLRMEYYENAGDAAAALSWSSASTPKQTVPPSQLHVLDANGNGEPDVQESGRPPSSAGVGPEGSESSCGATGAEALLLWILPLAARRRSRSRPRFASQARGAR